MSEYSSLSPDERLRAASDSLAIAGISHDPSDLKYVDSNQTVVGVGVADGTLDVQIRSRTNDLSNIAEFDRSSLVDNDTLNGQVVNDWMELGATLPRPGADPVYYETNIRALSAPDHLNRVQRALGREPGVNALQFEMAKGQGEMGLGMWVPPFARSAILIADPRTDWTTSEHDRQLDGGHLETWLHLNERFSRGIARRAARLIEIHGNHIELPEGRRPKDVDRFADALEISNDFINPIMLRIDRLLSATQRGDEHNLSTSLSRLGALLDSRSFDEAWATGSIRELHERMKDLGLAEGNSDSPHAKVELTDLIADRLQEITTTLQKADELWPSRNRAPEEAVARKLVLEHVGKIAATVQERGVEQSRDVLLSLSPDRADVTAEQLLEIASSKAVPTPDTYMTIPHARTQNEAVRDRTLPEQGLDQTPTVEPTPSPVEVPAPLTKSPLEIMLDQTTSVKKKAAEDATPQRLELQQRQALEMELGQDPRNRD